MAETPYIFKSSFKGIVGSSREGLSFERLFELPSLLALFAPIAGVAGWEFNWVEFY